MADEIVYKKMTRKADRGLEGKVVAKHGKQTNQKLKPYVVLEYLLKYSDANNTKSAYDIIGYLEGCGISAERRSIYRDIEDINRIMLMLDSGMRLGECSTVLVTDLELGRKRINLRAEETKGRKDRTVCLLHPGQCPLGA